MRAHDFLAPLLFIALGCGGAGTDSNTATGGQATGGNGTGTGGISASGGSSGSATTGGTVATGGNATGGKSTSTGGTATTTGGTATATGGTATATGGTSTTTGGAPTTTGGAGGATAGGLVDCDLRKVVCRVATPSCPNGQVPSVSGTCYGPCTRIESCACTTAAECPDNDQYTCWSRMHCGPYVD